MSFPYYRFFPGDYLRDTLHLGWLEDLAYRRLLDLYYMRGKPIVNDRAYIMRALRASEPEHQAAVDTVLAEFFVLQADGWHQKKADEELTRQNERSASASASARGRWKNKDIANANAMRTQCERNANQNQNQNHIKEKAITPPTPPSGECSADGSALPDWVPTESWKAFREHRKSIRKKMTPRAEALLLRDLGKIVETSGADPAEVIEQSIKNGWAGIFELKRGAYGGQQNQTSAAEREAARRRAVVDKLCGREGREDRQKTVRDI